MTNTINAPAPTGSHAIGRFGVTVTDPDREEIHSSKTDPRRLSLTIYYPHDGPMGKLESYDQDTLLFWERAQYWTKDQKDFLDKFSCYSQDGNHLLGEGERYPVVIFSHGFMASGSLYSYLLEEIASHGFIVVAVNHTFASCFSSIDGDMICGSMTQQDLFQTPFAHREQSVWIDDLSYVLELIQNKGIDTLQNSVDTDQIFVAGHSFGGSTALYLAEKYPTLAGCVNLEGPLFGREGINTLTCPTLILRGGESLKSMEASHCIEELQSLGGIDKESAENYQAAYLHRLESLASNSNDVDLVTLPGIDHIGFTDYNFLSQSRVFQGIPIGHLAPHEMIETIRGEVVPFLVSKMS